MKEQESTPMKYWNSRLKSMTEYIPGEQPKDIDQFIKLNTNENAFPPAPEILEYMKSKCNDALRLYPSPNSDELVEEFASQNGLSANQVFASNGSDELFTLIFRAFIDPEELAAFNYPSYSLYYTMSEANGISYDTIDLDDNFDIQFDSFLKKDYKLVIFCNPNNPTGTIVARNEFTSFLGKFKGLVVVDEAYVDFSNKGSMIDLVKKHDNLIVTRSLSKSYSLAGLRVGLAAAHKDIIAGFNKIKDSYNVDRLAAAGALAAIKNVKGLQYNVNMVKNNRDYLAEELATLGFVNVPSEANFILTRHPEIESEKLYEKLKERKILVRHFKTERISDYVRITVGSMMEIKKLLKALGEILQ